MEKRPLFNSVEQMGTVTFNMTNRLAIVVGWVIFWLLHAFALIALLAAFWITGTTAEDVETALRSASAQSPIAFASAIGFSALGVVSAYWSAAKWANKKAIGGMLIGYLLTDAKE